MNRRVTDKIPDFSFFDVVLASIISVIHFFVTRLYYDIVPNPYMDEVFHIPQARAYCDGNYTQWDPMITTPPLIYILTVLAGACGKERYFNSLLIGLCYLAALRYGRKQTKSRGWFPALAVVFLPVLFQTSCLYYTDMLSLSLVLLGLGTENRFISAVVFAASCLSRQTNIIWAGFYCFSNLVEHLKAKERDLFKNTVICLLIHWPFAFLGAGFLGYLYWNDGSLVLGDKTAHQIHFHVPQVYYFLLFTLGSSVPHLPTRITVLRKALWNYRYRLLAASVVMAVTIHFFSYNHPYLLADNRHYVFYIWRKWMLRHSLCKFLLIPLYLVSFLYFPI
ncbi:unnamed protein product [Bursaphelenchus xylophilus]|uniref:Dol-P-Glc:Glc(2)Man(9)GlcNAc(2)-PP-Dol alpha-1,2-glucosyltransferase n=1 Tax=Bursaphelenchus xylophilus TaxID=6326 RepID=A0A7I8XL33_BURXY|nr:unnamed protein product [Bursaphelenchus xylophilus]CAG9086399.1 unnamed protein product [Bursaphelenchus xylophilus]